MAQLIFKCPYIKGGGRNTSHLTHIANYISTRDGVEFIRNENRPATKKQEKLINEIIKDFPNSKTIFEYADYMQNKTVGNASAFISMALEYNIDRACKKENYVDYIANRPMVEKISSHGLFTAGDGEIILSQVAQSVANHDGNVWLPIIALRREDAVKSGFDNAQSWKLLLEQYALEIAKNLKIPDKNFRWYAAFHNHNHHPHVHMICYSTNPKEGFLTPVGIKNIKSGLMQSIYGDELKILYAEKSMKRDELKAESKKAVEHLFSKIAGGEIHATKLEQMLLELSENLKHTDGRRVYGYLPPRTKELVDAITDELTKEPSIAKAYDLWYELQNKVANNYSDKEIPKLPISQQKEFKSIKNHIIAQADVLSKGEINLLELEVAEPHESTIIPMESTNESVFEPMDSEDNSEGISSYVQWTDNYKKAREFLCGTDEFEPDFTKALTLLQAEAQNGNMLAVFDLGRMYGAGLGVDVNNETAQEYYKRALEGFLVAEREKPWRYLEYRIGKMFAEGLGVEPNDETAAHWFSLSANQKYKFAEYALGGLYYRGKGVEQSYIKAFELYEKSAKQGFPYGNFEVAKMLRDGIGTDKNEKQSRYHLIKAFTGFSFLEKQSHDDKLQYRLGSMLQNGIGTEKDIVKAKEYFEKSADQDNPFACYSLAKIILAEDSPTTEEVNRAIKLLNIALKNENHFAAYSLAKLYYEGKHIKQDTAKAISLFTISAEQNNEWATYSLGKIYLQDEKYKDISKAIDYFTKSAEQGNQFSQYALGKLYLMGKEVSRDKETALKWFTLSAQQGNEYAKFFIENMDKWQDPSLSFAVTNLLHHMGKIFENNHPPQKANMDMQIDSKRLQKLREKKIAAGHQLDDFEVKANY